MKRTFTAILAALMMIGCASCATRVGYDDNPLAPADTVNDLNMR